MAATGDKVPDFKLSTFEGDEITPESLAGKRSIICFYPFAFSGVCTEQFGVYQADIDKFKERGVDIYAVSVDSTFAQNEFKNKLGVTDITFAADFEPKGAVAQAFDTYREQGFSDRSVYEIKPDGTIGWAIKMDTPGEFPDTETVLAGLDA
ncbi:MAG: redoxin domain-containing protein [Solirubrobacterales bacterium]